MPRENDETHFKVSLFTAFDINGVMRNSKGPPWNNSKEISEQFRRTVSGKIALMGRKTYESLIAHDATNNLFSKKTPVTWHLVLTKDKKYKIREEDFAYRIGSLATIKNVWLQIEKEKHILGKGALPFISEIVVVGGVSLYQEMIDYADTIYAILYHAEFSGDEHFPLFFNAKEWEIISSSDSKEKRAGGQSQYTFVTYRRKTAPKKFLPLLKPSPLPPLPEEPGEKGSPEQK